MTKRAQKRSVDPLTPVIDDDDRRAKGWAGRAAPLTAAPRLEATISLRLGPDDANMLRRAARLTGTTKSEFVRRATIEAAKDVIEQREQRGIVVERFARVDQAATSKIAPQPVVAVGETTPAPTTVGTSAGVLTEVR